MRLPAGEQPMPQNSIPWGWEIMARSRLEGFMMGEDEAEERGTASTAGGGMRRNQENAKGAKPPQVTARQLLNAETVLPLSETFDSAQNPARV